MAIDLVTQVPLVGNVSQGYSGPSVATGADTVNEGYYVSFNSAGWTRVGPNAAYSLLAHASVIVNTATAIVNNVTLPANILNFSSATQAKNLQIYGAGVYSANGGPTLAIALKFGSTTLCTLTSDVTTNGATTMPFNFSFQVSTASAGSAGTLESHGQLNIVLGTSAAAAGAIYLDANTAVSSAVDLTAAITMSVTGLAAGASNAIVMRQYIVSLTN